MYFLSFSLTRKCKLAKVKFDCLGLVPNSKDLSELGALVDAGKLKSIIQGNVFEGIDKAPDAMAALEGGRTTGKVIVKIA